MVVQDIGSILSLFRCINCAIVQRNLSGICDDKWKPTYANVIRDGELDYVEVFLIFSLILTS